ncbi:MAG: TatD family hydrolase, partial [Muribaculum sp.]|nr:TatD family hydrolase [Muribaculum sp.]
MIIDTHTHLYLDEFTDKPAVVQRAIDAGVGHMIFPNVDLSTYEPMTELHRQFPLNTSVAVGLHPTEINANWQSDLDKTLRHIENTPDIVAIGEIGIDLYWDKTYRREQIEAFLQQIQWAVERNLPAIIHSRDGFDEIIAVLSEFQTPPAAVMHSFTGTIDDIKRIREVAPDIYFGINGIVTFKNSRLADTLPEIG